MSPEVAKNILGIFIVIGVGAFACGAEYIQRKEQAKGPVVMCILSGLALIGLTMWAGWVKFGKSTPYDICAIDYIVGYLVSATICCVLFIHDVVVAIIEKCKAAFGIVIAEGVIVAVCFGYGIWMLTIIVQNAI